MFFQESRGGLNNQLRDAARVHRCVPFDSVRARATLNHIVARFIDRLENEKLYPKSACDHSFVRACFRRRSLRWVKEETVPSSPETSAQITIEGWEPLPRSSTDYVGVILSQELSEGDGAGSRLIVQKGIPSSRTAQTHADNLSFDLQQQGVDVKTLGGREINGEDAAGFSYRSSTTERQIQTWHVVKDGLRYTINLESEERARTMGKDAEKVLDFIVLGD